MSSSSGKRAELCSCVWINSLLRHHWEHLRSPGIMIQQGICSFWQHSASCMISVCFSFSSCILFLLLPLLAASRVAQIVVDNFNCGISDFWALHCVTQNEAVSACNREGWQWCHPLLASRPDAQPQELPSPPRSASPESRAMGRGKEPTRHGKKQGRLKRGKKKKKEQDGACF